MSNEQIARQDNLRTFEEIQKYVKLLDIKWLGVLPVGSAWRAESERVKKMTSKIQTQDDTNHYKKQQKRMTFYALLLLAGLGIAKSSHSLPFACSATLFYVIISLIAISAIAIIGFEHWNMVKTNRHWHYGITNVVLFSVAISVAALLLMFIVPLPGWCPTLLN